MFPEERRLEHLREQKDLVHQLRSFFHSKILKLTIKVYFLIQYDLVHQLRFIFIIQKYLEPQ